VLISFGPNEWLTVKNSISALVRNVIDDLYTSLSAQLFFIKGSATHSLQAIEVSLIEGTSKSVSRRAQTFLLKGNAESIESLVDEEIDGAGTGPDVVRSKDTLTQRLVNVYATEIKQGDESSLQAISNYRIQLRIG